PQKPDRALDPTSNALPRYWYLLGHLKPGISEREAVADFDVVARRLSQVYPKDYPKHFTVEVMALAEQVVGQFRSTLLTVLGAVGLLLLIGCANVANLLLARGAARGREFAVRAALGASRLRLLRQMLTESVLLALGAGLAGCAVAALGVRALVAFAPPGIPRLDEIRLDGAVLLFTAGLSLLAGLLFGLAPAWQVSEQRPNEALKEGSPSATGSLRLRQTRGLLVVGECALAVVLLAGAGLLVRSFLRLQAVEPGFKPEGVLLVQVSMLPSVGRKDISSLYQQLRERLRALPGVQAVGTIGDNRGAFPRTASPDGKSKIIVEGRSSASEQVSVTLVSPQVDPGFLPAIGAPLLKGRFYAEQDLPLPVPREFNAETVVLNETLARQLFHDADPIGRRISQDGDWQTVVGVVGDMRRQGLEQQPFAELYRLATPIYTWVMRTAGVDPLALGAPIRAAVRSADQSLTVTSVLPLKQRMAELTAERRFQTWLLALFSAVALTLAAIGIYGVMHYTVAQRTHELGIRIALGASRSDVLRLMIGQGMKLALLGVAVGLIVSLWLTRVLAHLLFGVSETDPATFGGVAILLAGVALLACYLPARKAAKVDPIAALRCE
ncbi:MAG: ADOP family duplicated permease, partial [Blastocatellia bacterium]